MAKRWRLPTVAQREQLLRLITLRQTEAPSEDLRMAYWRLETALTKRVNGTPDDVILDWLEAELEILRRTGISTSEIEAALLARAIEFCEALRN